MSIQHDNIQINNLRVVNKTSFNPSYIQSVAKQLISSDINHNEIPPSAVLLVNKITLSHTTKRTQTVAYPQRQKWTNRVNNQLNTFFHEAVKPIRGNLPEYAKSILFQDVAELVACLLLDMIAGKHPDHWWCQSILNNLPTAVLNDPYALLSYHIRELPGILGYLNSWGKEQELLQSISGGQARELLQNLATEFHLADELLPPTPSIIIETLPIKLLKASSTQKVLPPWSRWCSDILPESLPAIKHCLMGIATGLNNDSAELRSAEFSLANSYWWDEWLKNAEVYSSQSERSNFDRQDEGHGANQISKAYNTHADKTSGTNISAAEASVNKKPQSIYKEHENEVISAEDREEQGKKRESLTDLAKNKQSISAKTGRWVASDLLTQQSPEPEIISHQTKFKSESPDKLLSNQHWQEGVQTRLGGMLYLLNLIHYLDLPDCFQQQCQLGSQLSLWSLLELIAKGLLGERYHEFSNDPIWSVLSELDSRKCSDIKGENFQFSGEYHIPKSWFEAISSEYDHYQWIYDQSKLSLWSDGGFVVQQKNCLDLTKLQAKKQVTTLLQHYLNASIRGLESGALHQLPLAHFKQTSLESLLPPLSTWLALMLPALKLRLLQALSLGPNADSSDLAKLMFCPGKLYISATHIDLIMSLDSISLPARAAGLDRNPGWLADIGRVVNFQYR